MSRKIYLFLKLATPLATMLLLLSGCGGASKFLGDNLGNSLPELGKLENIIGTTLFEDSVYASYTFNLPEGAVVVGEDIYVAETFNNVIKKIDASGKVTLFAGIGLKGFNGDNELKSTQLAHPTEILYFDGSLIFKDTENYLVRKINLSTKTIQTIAGIGTQHGFPEDGALAVNSKIESSSSFGINNNGEIILPMTDLSTNEFRLFKIDRNGFFRNIPIPQILRSGQAAAIVLEGQYIYLEFNLIDNDKRFVKIDYNGNLLKDIDLIDSFGSALCRLNDSIWLYGLGTAIGRVNENTGETGSFSSGVYGNVTGVVRKGSHLLVVDSDKGKLIVISDMGLFISESGSLAAVVPKVIVSGAVYDEHHLLFLDNGGGRIFKYELATKKLTVFAGNGRNEVAVEGDKFNTGFHYPTGIAVDSNKNVFVNENHRILKINREGKLSVFSGAVAYGDVSNTHRINARYQSIRSLRVDHYDNLYVSDTYNNKVKKIDATGYVATVLDGLNHPYGVEPLADGTLNVADSWNNYVITYDGLSTKPFAGQKRTGSYQGQGGDAGEGLQALQSTLNTPYMTVTTESGMYILDTFNHKVKFIDAQTGKIRTLFGSGVQGYSENTLNLPVSMFRHKECIYVMDTGNSLVRRFLIN